MRFVSLLILGVAVVGCCSRNSCEMTRYHEDGRAKPTVMIPTMIDTSSFDVPWSISEELTATLTQKLTGTGQLYVVKNEDVAFTENPFSPDLSWMKREFPHQEFVVFLELVEHETVPADKSKSDVPLPELSTNLNMAVRMRVIDMRGHTPKVVLQETVRNSYFIPRTLLPTNYNVVIWGTSEYEESSMKNAHDALVNEITSRVTDYILLAKSR
ncbi:MAG: hypothetical protein HY069_01360 [Chlamydiia bacterium]|nr:hypothetical protein [Chlamydiia bacterium]